MGFPILKFLPFDISAFFSTITAFALVLDNKWLYFLFATKVIDVLFAHWIVAMLSTKSSLPTSFDPVIDANSDNLKLLGFDTTQIVMWAQQQQHLT